MNILDFKEGQTYICTKSDKQWWTVGKEYPVFLDSDNEPAIRDDDGDDWHSSFLSITINQFKLKEEQPKVTLDEPQKPVVPKFVAEWIEYAKKKGDSLAISFKPWNLYGVEYSKADRWIEDNQETFARAWIDGYEVEKEPLYEVIIGDLYLIKKFNNRNDFYFDTSCSLCAWEKSAYQLTEAEIKAIDERYWPFAVPVEEGLEQEEAE
ncbi:TPA: DUF1642 domain-containing protein [Enterococcus faecium]|uniref:DUF1642 domain-containing protein n=2 Tax=Enterococcus faecium TaxID=1352 RepID=UPI00192374C8|nr:DUF1642 domain-containing protein [Enterococcus faecium]QQV81680.1 DUF1642 domain-containing protein [Enterococcus faecium]